MSNFIIYRFITIFYSRASKKILRPIVNDFDPSSQISLSYIIYKFIIIYY